MPQVHTPLAPIHFWGIFWSAHFTACWKREMLHVTNLKLEIHLCKTGLVDSKWSNLHAPGSYTPCSHSLLWSIMECPFRCMPKSALVHSTAAAKVGLGRLGWRGEFVGLIFEFQNTGIDPLIFEFRIILIFIGRSTPKRTNLNTTPANLIERSSTALKRLNTALVDDVGVDVNPVRGRSLTHPRREEQ